MIWIIGGTSESRELVDRIRDLDEFLISSATEAGREFIDSDNLIVGRMSYEEMLKFVEDNNISIIINLAHPPYATIVTENAKNVARESGIKYIRYTRRKTAENFKGIYLNNYEETYDYISKLKGNIFFLPLVPKILEISKGLEEKIGLYIEYYQLWKV